jgi:hypothetical protein
MVFKNPFGKRASADVSLAHEDQPLRWSLKPGIVSIQTDAAIDLIMAIAQQALLAAKPVHDVFTERHAASIP